MRFQEKIGSLTKTSSTQVQLSGSSLVKLGGQFYSLSSPTLLTSTTGIGGLDTGAIAASSFYYVYAVSNGTTQGIVASLSATSPSGFTRYSKVGEFQTNSLSEVSTVISYDNTSIIRESLRLINTVGIAPSFSARAWVNFVGSSGSINASGNIASVTRNGTGDYTIAFTTPMSDTNYAVCGMVRGVNSPTNSANIQLNDVSVSKTVNGFRILTEATSNGAAQDYPDVSVIVFR
jgi:hypothetical protein